MILDISDSPALNDGADEFVLGLAYEVRHAYEGARKTSTVSLPGMPPTSYFHFKTLWPIFLMQVALLRWSAAFQPTNKEHQSNLYRLEPAQMNLCIPLIHLSRDVVLSGLLRSKDSNEVTCSSL
jgi:hypothetical protein